MTDIASEQALEGIGRQEPATACLVVTAVDGMIALRDAADPAHRPFLYTPAEWEAFLAGAKVGEFDHLFET